MHPAQCTQHVPQCAPTDKQVARHCDVQQIRAVMRMCSGAMSSRYEQLMRMCGRGVRGRADGARTLAKPRSALNRSRGRPEQGSQSLYIHASQRT
jgi:hypothetical protein